MPHDPTDPCEPHRWRRCAVLLGGVALASGLWFEWGRSAEPPFVDEWAYVSQAYFGPLLAQPNSPQWLGYAAFDLPPLPKYLIAAALATAGQPIPGPGAMRRWYADTSSQFGPHAMLAAARVPSVWLGALGCVAVAALGRQYAGPRVGLLAAALLAVDPLYRMHARRAMSDVPAEALVLASLAVGLATGAAWLEGRGRPAWRWLGVVLSGALAGLAVLAKLNGGLALMTLGAWALGAALLPGTPFGRRLALPGAWLAAAVVAFGVFLGLNPFLTSRPDNPARLTPELREIAAEGIPARTLRVIRHRLEVSRAGRSLFPDDAVHGLVEAAPVVAVQGFGRFGPLGRMLPVEPERRRDPERHPWDFDSRVRFDWRQDAGALVWLPLVTAGLTVALRRGGAERAAGRVPLSWALAAQFGMALVTVVLFLPMAWDRYFLPLQAPAALLGALAVVAGWDALARRTRRSGDGTS